MSVSLYEAAPGPSLGQFISGCYDSFTAGLPVPTPGVVTIANVHAGTSYFILVDSWSFSMTAYYKSLYTINVLYNPVAQACSNAGFETGNFSDWYGTTGYSQLCYNAQASHANYCGYASGTNTSQFSIMNGGTDAYGGFPRVFQGGYSAMLGDGTVPNNGAAQLIQSFEVTNSASAYTFSYAMVIQDGQHEDTVQSYFHIKMFDENGDPIACSEYLAIAAANMPGFVQSALDPEVHYCSWQSITVDLAAYIGQIVTLIVTVSDCSGNAHFAYAYLDCTCTVAELTASGCNPVTINAPPGYSSYSWTPGGQTTQSVSVTSSGLYCCDLVQNGCTLHLCKDIIVGNLNMNTTVTNVSCNGANDGSATVIVSGTPNYSYEWSNLQSTLNSPNSSNTISGLAPGTYYVTVTDGTTCQGIDTVIITAPTQLVIDAGQDQTICEGDTTIIAVIASGGVGTYSYAWNNGAGILDSAMVSPPLGSTTFTVSVTDACETITDQVTVNVIDCSNPCNISGITTMIIPCTPSSGLYSVSGQVTFIDPPSTGTLNITSSCGGNTVTLNAPFTSPASYTISNLSANGSNCSITAAFSGAAGCTYTQTYIAPEEVTVTPGSSITLTCTNPTGTISATGYPVTVTYQWTGPSIISGGNTSSPTVGSAGTYTVIVTDPATGCTNSATVAVNGNSTLPNVNAGISQTLTCNTTSVVLNGSSTTTGATASWSGPGIISGGNTFTPIADQPGTYTLVVTDPSNGCTATAIVDVDSNTILPNADAGSPQIITCLLPTAVLNGSSTTTGATALWSGPGIVSGGNTFTPTVNAAGTYTITVTDPANGCISSDAVIVTSSITTPNLTMGSPLILTCTAPTGTISAASTVSGITYNWTGPGIVSGAITANPTVNATGTYTVVITDPANGCTNTGIVSVTSNITPPNVTTGSPLTLTCTILNGVISVSSTTPGSTFSWTGPGIVSGDNTATPTVDAAGSYTVLVTDPANGCTVSGIVNVASSTSSPTVTTGSPLTLTCAASSGTISVSSSPSGVSYSWSGPGIVTGATTSSPTVNTDGTYTVLVTDISNGCTATASVVVSSDTVHPSINSIPAEVLPCVPHNISLFASSGTPGVIYNWTGPGIISGGNTASPTVNQTGNYMVLVTNPSNGCTTSASAIVNPAPIPSSNISEYSNIACNGESNGMATVAATGGTFPYSYLWNTPNPQTTSTAINLDAGIWMVTVTDEYGCTSVSSVTIVQADPIFVMASSDLTICPGEPTVLNASATGGTPPYTWYWNGSISGPSITVSPVSDVIYTVSVTDVNNCPAVSDQVVVHVLSQIFVDVFLNETYVCPGDPVLVGVSINQGTGGPYIITDGNGAVVSPPYIIYPPQDESITLQATDGCSTDSDTETIKVYSLPPISFSSDTIQGCQPLTVCFIENSPDYGQTFVWNFGDEDHNNLSN
ncbi:MAG: hypothetical protein ABIJ16_08520, partial [Bacteroidota bacterium]